MCYTIFQCLFRNGVSHLPNGLVEIDGAIDDPQYDRASLEPQATAPLETFRVVQATQEPSTITRVASTTLRSNFVLLDNQV